MARREDKVFHEARESAHEPCSIGHIWILERWKGENRRGFSVGSCVPGAEALGFVAGW